MIKSPLFTSVLKRCATLFSLSNGMFLYMSTYDVEKHMHLGCPQALPPAGLRADLNIQCKERVAQGAVFQPCQYCRSAALPLQG